MLNYRRHKSTYQYLPELTKQASAKWSNDDALFISISYGEEQDQITVLSLELSKVRSASSRKKPSVAKDKFKGDNGFKKDKKYKKG